MKVGLVVLPSPWLDTCSEVWIDAIREFPSIAVNRAFFSQRLWDADAVPNYAVMLDAHGWYRNNCPAVEFEKPFQEAKNTCVYGGYDFGFRQRKVWQKRKRDKDGRMFPVWCGPEDTATKEDGVYHFAGSYSSIAACNIMAMELGWDCRILVIGHDGTGGYCRARIPIKGSMLKEEAARKTIAMASNEVWGRMAHDAMRHGTHIVHVRSPHVKGLTTASERNTLDFLMARRETQVMEAIND